MQEAVFWSCLEFFFSSRLRVKSIDNNEYYLFWNLINFDFNRPRGIVCNTVCSSFPQWSLNRKIVYSKSQYHYTDGDSKSTRLNRIENEKNQSTSSAQTKKLHPPRKKPIPGIPSSRSGIALSDCPLLQARIALSIPIPSWPCASERRSGSVARARAPALTIWKERGRPGWWCIAREQAQPPAGGSRGHVTRPPAAYHWSFPGERHGRELSFANASSLWRMLRACRLRLKFTHVNGQVTVGGDEIF